MALSRSDRQRRPSPFGPSLPRLANDGEVLLAGAPPRFPHALLLSDVKLGEAVQAGDPDHVETARQRLTEGVQRLMVSDRDRLAKLPDGSEHAAERSFLHDRLAVLELRLSALEHPLPVPAAPPRPAVDARIPAAAANLRPAATTSEAPMAPGGDGTSHAVA
ncbi:MAG TPA: hypothetical protein VNR66_03840 [Solirubrobacteraceae bacterium]|nr:hypothetical protein [Solirubrobacteraceae bacterium]